MREIKFRAYHKGAKEILFGNNENTFRWQAEGQPIELMQFTGLKDKNGKEIYEGDILTSTLGNGLPCQIKFGEFHDDAERDFDNITFIGFYFHEQTGERTAFGKSIYGNTECFEIIGNIYENPELLTP